VSELEAIQKNFLAQVLGDQSREPYEVKAYRSIVAENHRSALSDTYPVCEQIVGKDYFKLLAWNYLRLDPPEDPDLNFFGESFPSFLEDWFLNQSPYEELAYLKDIAALEWGIYYLQQTFSESEIFLDVNCNALEIWQAHQDDSKTKQIEELERKTIRQNIQIRRENGQVMARSTSQTS